MAGGSASHEHRVWARIDHAALRHNFAVARARAGRDAVFAVVKADAYGHGAAAVARTLVAAGCERLAVVSVEEACVLRDSGVEAPLLVLGGVDGPAGAAEAAGRGLAVAVQRAEQLAWLAAAGRPVAVHLEIDTGMHRMGAHPEEVPDLVTRVLAAPQLELVGAMTHLARADEADLAPSLDQLARFDAGLAAVRAGGGAPRFVHVGNSAALLAGTLLRDACPAINAVRPGLMLYGARPARHVDAELVPVMRLEARVLQVHDVPAGGAVGYGALWRAEQPTRVATLGLGYADGLPVAATNRGSVVIRGARHRLVGRVSMDSVGVDVGASPVAAGDVALLFGATEAPELRVEAAADAAGTISYELLTRVGARVPRLHEGAVA